MKIAVLADIHSNLKALETAVDIIAEEKVAKTFVCGDVVGYGQQPNQCCELVRSRHFTVVAGNHDWAVAGLTDYKDTHSMAAVTGIENTKAVITPDNLRWLKSLPLCHKEWDAEFVHASLPNPEKWRYLTLGGAFVESAYRDVHETFMVMKGHVCFVGHSHIPSIFLEKKANRVEVIDPGKAFHELDGKRAVIDVGSVGRPRVSSKKGSVVIYDSEERKVSFRRFKIR